MSAFPTGDVRFLRLIRRMLVHHGRWTPRALARRIGEDEADVEAALFHLKARGEVKYTKRKSAGHK